MKQDFKYITVTTDSSKIHVKSNEDVKIKNFFIELILEITPKNSQSTGKFVIKSLVISIDDIGYLKKRKIDFSDEKWNDFFRFKSFSWQKCKISKIIIQQVQYCYDYKIVGKETTFSLYKYTRNPNPVDRTRPPLNSKMIQYTTRYGYPNLIFYLSIQDNNNLVNHSSIYLQNLFLTFTKNLKTFEKKASILVPSKNVFFNEEMIDSLSKSKDDLVLEFLRCDFSLLGPKDKTQVKRLKLKRVGPGCYVQYIKNLTPTTAISSGSVEQSKQIKNTTSKVMQQASPTQTKKKKSSSKNKGASNKKNSQKAPLVQNYETGLVGFSFKEPNNDSCLHTLMILRGHDTHKGHKVLDEVKYLKYLSKSFVPTTVPITVHYCCDCRNYFDFEESFIRQIRQYHIHGRSILTKLLNYRQDIYKFPDEYSDMASISFNDASPLSYFGYHVGEHGRTRSERQKILVAIIENKIMTVTAIKSLLQQFIHYNGARKNMDKAIADWKEDIDFLNAYVKDHKK